MGTVGESHAHAILLLLLLLLLMLYISLAQQCLLLLMLKSKVRVGHYIIVKEHGNVSPIQFNSATGTENKSVKSSLEIGLINVSNGLYQSPRRWCL